MKVCRIIFYILIFCSISMAKEKMICTEGSGSCKIMLVNQDDKIHLIKDNQQIFDEPEVGGTMNMYYLYKNGDKYQLSMESYSSSRNRVSVIFDEDFTTLSYLDISKEINTNENRAYLDGVYCSSSNIEMDKKNIPILPWAFLAVCKNNSSMSNTTYKIVNNDLIFEISNFNEGKPASNIELIALDFKENDNTSDFGCIKNCSLIKDKSNFLGRIDKYRIRMFLNNEAQDINGYYKYDRYGEKIYLKGTKKGNKITLSVKDKNDKTIEKFEGVLTDGIFSGQWSNINNKSILPFSLYSSMY